MSDWYLKEDFWTNFGPIMFDDNRWAEAPDVAEYVKKIAGLKDGDSVMDAGCGVGRIAVELAALGLDVTGVDIIQSELDAAKDSAEAEGVPLTLINADLRTFKAPIKSKCAVNLYTSFGYCDTIEEDFTILKNIADSIEDGGTFIMECTSRETAIMYFTKGEEFERAGYKVVTDFGVVGDWEGLRSHWTLYGQGEKTGQVIDHEFVQRLYSAVELREYLKTVGFKSVNVYGDFDYSPYDEKARTMILVCRK